MGSKTDSNGNYKMTRPEAQLRLGNWTRNLRAKVEALIVGQTADFSDERHKANYSHSKQPQLAIDGHEQAFHKHRAHRNPDQKRQKQFHSRG